MHLAMSAPSPFFFFRKAEKTSKLELNTCTPNHHSPPPNKNKLRSINRANPLPEAITFTHNHTTPDTPRYNYMLQRSFINSQGSAKDFLLSRNERRTHVELRARCICQRGLDTWSTALQLINPPGCQLIVATAQVLYMCLSRARRPPRRSSQLRARAPRRRRRRDSRAGLACVRWFIGWLVG